MQPQLVHLSDMEEVMQHMLVNGKRVDSEVIAGNIESSQLLIPAGKKNAAEKNTIVYMPLKCYKTKRNSEMGCERGQVGKGRIPSLRPD